MTDKIPDEAAASGETILIVEDTALTRDALSSLLRAEGYRVAAASSGEEALAYLEKQGRPGLMLLDPEMPVMNGPELRQRMRANPDWEPIPVIVLSARQIAPEVRAELKAIAFYPKPFHLRDLLDRVRQSLPATRE
jgi:CheY-like chemotaxis protein